MVPPSTNASSHEVSWGLGETSVSGFVAFLKGIILATGARQVCDVGGGAKPVLPLDIVDELNLDYTVLDASVAELDKTPDGYRKLHADILRSEQLPAAQFDLVFSRMVAEHMIDAARFHTNVGRMLSPAGRAVHFFPTLYEPVFIANRVLPERLATAALLTIAPWRGPAGAAAKFPAYYRWCRGPSARQARRFRRVGLEIEHYAGFFGTTSYYRRLPALQALDDRVSRWLVRHPVSALTSYAYVVLRPAGSLPA